MKVSNKKYTAWHVIEREAFILQLLQKHPKHFPQYVTHTSDYIVMKWAGQKLTNTNKPENIATQIDNILSILYSEKIRHNDIKDGELLVDPNGNIVLVDFGWAMINESLNFGSTVVNGKRPCFSYYNKTDRELLNIVLSNL
jgi:RIO-like serine/threonine protein kinase